MSTITTPVKLACQNLPNVPWGDWPGLAKVLAGAPVCELGQAWLATPSPGFRPSRVWTGWTSQALIVYAELEDVDIFNPVTEFNALAFRSGDVFEMFLRPENQAAYYEFHITPGNQKLQLRIPSATAFEEARRQPCIPAEWFVTSRVVESQVRVDEAAERWSVVAEVPFDLVAEKGRPQTGDCWRFSFSRLDYTRGESEPVLSSSSSHTECNFHRQQEWGILQLTDER